MDKELKSRIKRYLRDVKSELKVSFNTKFVFCKKLKNQIEEYLEENPEATFEEIVIRFGPPELIAENFDSAKDSSLRIGSFALGAFWFILLLAVVILSIAGIMSLGEDFNLMEFLQKPLV